jgi:hypothetical protein
MRRMVLAPGADPETSTGGIRHSCWSNGLCFLCAGMIRGSTAGCAKPLASSGIPHDVQVLGHFQNLYEQQPALAEAAGLESPL